MAEIIRVDPVTPDSAAIARAAGILRSGGLVAFPTETVYGLGADATNRAAVVRIFEAKGRPSTDPLIVHVLDLAAARQVVAHMPPAAEALAAAFWPGPLTMVLSRSSRIGHEVTAGLDTVAVRVPAHPVARALIAAAGRPIAAPSANLFSRPSPTTAAHVTLDLGERIECILDGGPTMVGLESTVVDLTVSPPVVLRPGGVTLERLREVIPAFTVPRAGLQVDGPMTSPGMLSKHYAPATPLTLYEGSPSAVLARVIVELRLAIDTATPMVVLASTEQLRAVSDVTPAGEHHSLVQFVDLGSESAPEEMAARLYSALRECDENRSAVRILAMQVPGDDGMKAAIRDRLRRASAGDIVRAGEPAPNLA